MDQYYASNNMANPLKPKIAQINSVDSSKTVIKHLTSNNSFNTLNMLSPTFTEDGIGTDNDNEAQYSSNEYINLKRTDSDASENTYASTHVASTIATRCTHETVVVIA